MLGHGRLHGITVGNWRTLLPFVGIVVIASALRLYRLDLIDFRFDQGYALQYGLDIARGYLWPVQPYGSVGVHPAVYLYVMALPNLFSHSFLAVVTFRVMIDVAAVAMCWLIGTRYFGWTAGLVAAFLYATAPWAIQFARNTWPVPQPLFSAILLLGLLEIVQRPSGWGSALTGIGLALCLGTHLAALYVVPVVLVALWLGRKRLRPLPLALSILPLLIVTGVYVAYDGSHQFASIRAMLATFGKPQQFTWDALQFGVWLSGGTHLSDLTGQAYPHWITLMPQALNIIDTLQVALLITGILAMGCRLVDSALRRTADPAGRQGDSHGMQRRAGLLVLLWWFVPIALQLRHSQPVTMQYLITILPAPFLLMGIGADGFLDLTKRWLPGLVARRAITTAVVSGIVAIAGWQILTTVTFTQFIERYDTINGYGLPVHSALAAAQHAREASAAGASDQVIAVIQDYVTPWNEQAVILNDVLADMPHRFLNSDVDGWIFRPEGTSYVFAPGTDQALQGLLSYVEATNIVTAMTPIRTELSIGYTYVYVKGMPRLDNFVQAHPATWDSGIELVNYRISHVKDALRVETVLKVLRTPPDNVDYHWFNHVFVGPTKVAQMDGSGIHPTAWRAGDFLLARYDIPIDRQLPPGPAHVRIGSYSYPDIKSVMVTEEGQPPDNGVDLVVPSP